MRDGCGLALKEISLTEAHFRDWLRKELSFIIWDSHSGKLFLVIETFNNAAKSPNLDSGPKIICEGHCNLHFDKTALAWSLVKLLHVSEKIQVVSSF